MDDNQRASIDLADEDALACTVSDEALEAAAADSRDGLTYASAWGATARPCC